MSRLLGLILLAGIAIVLLLQGAEKISISIDWMSYFLGIMTLAGAGFLGFQISNWWSAVTRPYRPQVVQHETLETPAQVVRANVRARLVGGMLFTSLVIVLMAWIKFFVVDIPLVILLLSPIVFLVAFFAPNFIAYSIVARPAKRKEVSEHHTEIAEVRTELGEGAEKTIDTTTHRENTEIPQRGSGIAQGNIELSAKIF